MTQQHPQQQRIDPDSLPVDMVILAIWTGNDPQPMQITVTRESWKGFLDLMSSAAGIDPTVTYEFDGQTSPGGRRTKFFFLGVNRVSANYHSGIVPANG